MSDQLVDRMAEIIGRAVWPADGNGNTPTTAPEDAARAIGSLLGTEVARLRSEVAEAEARGYQRAIDALQAMGRIFEVPDELLHAVDLAAPGRFGFGINDSSEVADICRRVVLSAAERLEAITGEPANQTAGETDA